VLAAWYERQGPASEVFRVGEMAAPEPDPGEVRVWVNLSGVNPGDTKKRGDWVGYGMPYPRIVPHSDGSGVLDAVGDGVDGARVGWRVWVYGAQSYRPFGTAAQLTVVPAEQAVELPDEVSDELGACLGIPGITAHRAVFADGPVTGKTVLVQGVLDTEAPQMRGFLLGERAWRSGGDWAQTLQHEGTAQEKVAVSRDFEPQRAPAGAVRSLAHIQAWLRCPLLARSTSFRNQRARRELSAIPARSEGSADHRPC
jgi:hypothetical protein